jgi:hypothetical protein
MGLASISQDLLKRVRDYAVEEPSYTVAFAAWELKLSKTAINLANAELLRLGIVHEIEPRKGPYAAVYSYRPIPGDSHSPRRRVEPPAQQSPSAVGTSAPVPYTGKPKGPNGRANRSSAHRVRRPKTKGRRT